MISKFPRTRLRCRAAGLAARPRFAGDCLLWFEAAAARAIPPLVLVAVLVAGCLALLDAAAYASVDSPTPHLGAKELTIDEVVNRLRLWLMGILAAVATLFLTIGGVRYVIADGDPGQVEKAKSALTSAGVGYALAALAPVLLTVVQGLVK